MNLKQIIKNIISDALTELEIEYDDSKIVIEIPKDRKNGDFSTNIAMQLVKILKAELNQ